MTRIFTILLFVSLVRHFTPHYMRFVSSVVECNVNVTIQSAQVSLNTTMQNSANANDNHTTCPTERLVLAIIIAILIILVTILFVCLMRLRKVVNKTKRSENKDLIKNTAAISIPVSGSDEMFSYDDTDVNETLLSKLKSGSSDSKASFTVVPKDHDVIQGQRPGILKVKFGECLTKTRETTSSLVEKSIKLDSVS